MGRINGISALPILSNAVPRILSWHKSVTYRHILAQSPGGLSDYGPRWRGLKDKASLTQNTNLHHRLSKGGVLLPHRVSPAAAISLIEIEGLLPGTTTSHSNSSTIGPLPSVSVSFSLALPFPRSSVVDLQSRVSWNESVSSCGPHSTSLLYLQGRPSP